MLDLPPELKFWREFPAPDGVRKFVEFMRVSRILRDAVLNAANARREDEHKQTES